MKILWFTGTNNVHNEAIVVILMRAHCFHDYICIYILVVMLRKNITVVLRRVSVTKS